jgi:hypothetical protein
MRAAVRSGEVAEEPSRKDGRELMALTIVTHSQQVSLPATGNVRRRTNLGRQALKSRALILLDIEIFQSRRFGRRHWAG